MDALLLLSIEVVVLGIAIWVVIMDAKPAEDVSRMLDSQPYPEAKKRFGDTALLRAPPFRRPGTTRS